MDNTLNDYIVTGFFTKSQISRKNRANLFVPLLIQVGLNETSRQRVRCRSSRSKPWEKWWPISHLSTESLARVLPIYPSSESFLFLVTDWKQLVE